jgi:cell division protein FtsZ
MTETGKIPDHVIIGVGGAGNRILDQMKATQFPNVKTVAVDTDKESLDATQADTHILLGNNRIKGWGEGNPDETRAAVVGAHSEIEALIKPRDIIFIVAGMGCGAGSGATPQIAEIARDKEALVIALVTMPFLIQRKTINNAKDGLQRLLRYTDSVIVMDNDRYRSRFCNCSVEQIHSNVNGMMIDVITGIIESLTIPRLINVDYDDVKVIFGNKGLAILLSGESGEREKNEDEFVVRKCLNSPSFDVDYRGASGCFVLITGGYKLDLYDSEVIATAFTYDLDPHADIVWAANVEKPMEGRIRVYAIVTGIRWKISQRYGGCNDRLR